MSGEAGWWACARDWHMSPMFDGVTSPGPLLAWIGLLTHASAFGRGGRVRLNVRHLCRDFRVTEDDVNTMIELARQHGSARLDHEIVVLVNWRKYQDAHVRRRQAAQNAQNADSLCAFTEMQQTAPTKPSPITKQSQSQEQNPSGSPTTDAKPSVAGGGEAPMSGGETPTGKDPTVTLDRERWVWVGITESRLAVWRQAYPAVDIQRELAKAAAWCRDAGPRGVRKQWGRFLTGWLSRAQDRGVGPQNASQPAKAIPGDAGLALGVW